jgi:hypothetical protein
MMRPSPGRTARAFTWGAGTACQGVARPSPPPKLRSSDPAGVNRATHGTGSEVPVGLPYPATSTFPSGNNSIATGVALYMRNGARAMPPTPKDTSGAPSSRYRATSTEYLGNGSCSLA